MAVPRRPIGPLSVVLVVAAVAIRVIYPFLRLQPSVYGEDRSAWEFGQSGLQHLAIIVSIVALVVPVGFFIAAARGKIVPVAGGVLLGVGLQTLVGSVVALLNDLGYARRFGLRTDLAYADASLVAAYGLCWLLVAARILLARPPPTPPMPIGAMAPEGPELLHEPG